MQTKEEDNSGQEIGIVIKEEKSGYQWSRGMSSCEYGKEMMPGPLGT